MSMMSGCQPSAISLVLVILVFASMPLTDECVSACYVKLARYTWHSFIFFKIYASYFCIYLIKKSIKKAEIRLCKLLFVKLNIISYNEFSSVFNLSINLIYFTNILWTQYEKSVNLQIIIEQRIDWIYDAITISIEENLFNKQIHLMNQRYWFPVFMQLYNCPHFFLLFWHSSTQVNRLFVASSKSVELIFNIFAIPLFRRLSNRSLDNSYKDGG